MAKPYTVTRETIVRAPAEVIHDLLDDFPSWQRWSPWEDLDPQMQRTYAGADSGVGARYAWEGNKKAGKGTMQITGDEPQRVDVALAFEKPFPSTSDVAFVITPQETDETHVEWSMSGELSTPMRLFALVKPMDELVGPDMEKGLARLKEQAERDAGTL